MCVSSCVSAPWAPPAPPARCRAPQPPPAARCWPRAALQPAPAAAPRAPPPPHAPPAAPAGRARSPPAGLFGPAGPAALIDPPRRCAPDGSGFEPRRAAEPATSSEVPFDSVPKGVEIHSGFSSRWRLQGVSSGLDSAASREGELACVKTRSGILPALSLGPPPWPSPELAHSWSLGAPPSMRD